MTTMEVSFKIIKKHDKFITLDLCCIQIILKLCFVLKLQHLNPLKMVFVIRFSASNNKSLSVYSRLFSET